MGRVRSAVTQTGPRRVGGWMGVVEGNK
jgi:hypothetical protein